MEKKHENVERPLKKIFINNFIGGIAWFLGATIGAAILLSILAFFASKIDFVPLVSDFVAEVTQSALQKTSQPVK